MRLELALHRIVICCAVMLLFAPLSGRTTWVKGNVTAIDAAGYNIAAVISGIVALSAIAIAMRMRQNVVVSALALSMATVAFFFTLLAAGVDVWARMQGQVWSYAGGSMSRPQRGWTVYPTLGPPIFVVVAPIGILSTISLAIVRLRRRRSGSISTIMSGRAI